MVIIYLLLQKQYPSVETIFTPIFFPLASSKKNIRIDPREVLTYFKNIVCPCTAKQLHSVSIAKSICHLAVQINGHNIAVFDIVYHVKFAKCCCLHYLLEDTIKFCLL